MNDSKVAKLESQSAKMYERPPGIAAYIVVCCCFLLLFLFCLGPQVASGKSV